MKPRTHMHLRLLCASALVAVASAVALAAGPANATTPPYVLLLRHQPVTVFDPAERFRPAGVRGFVEDSTLERLTASGWVVADPDPKLSTLPGPGSGTWRLNQQPCSPAATLGGLACYAGASGARPRFPVVYGRVVHSGDRIVLQYWSFYYDNTYSYVYPPTDFIWQAHEGDWEVVNVVLSSAEEPLFVGYSQHCTGTRRAWPTTPRVGRTHPVVYVAVGSHANELSPGLHPIAVECIPPAAVALLQQQGLPLPRDVAGPGPVAGAPGPGRTMTLVRMIGEGQPFVSQWLSFPGFWGELQYFHAPGPIGTVAAGTSPVGPVYQAVWSDPLGTLATWPLG